VVLVVVDECFLMCVKTSIPAQLQYQVSEKTFSFGQRLLQLFHEPTLVGKAKAVLKLI